MDPNFAFTATGGSITIPAGQGSVSLTLTPVDDRLVEGNETAVLAVAPAINYVTGGAPATGTINDNDFATVSFATGTSRPTRAMARTTST